MTSMFSFDLAQPPIAGPTTCGPAHGVAARTVMRAIAEHFDLPFVVIADTAPDLLKCGRNLAQSAIRT